MESNRSLYIDTENELKGVVSEHKKRDAAGEEEEYHFGPMKRAPRERCTYGANGPETVCMENVRIVIDPNLFTSGEAEVVLMLRGPKTEEQLKEIVARTKRVMKDRTVMFDADDIDDDGGMPFIKSNVVDRLAKT